MSAERGDIASVTQLDSSQGKAGPRLSWLPLLRDQQLPKILVTCYEHTDTEQSCGFSAKPILKEGSEDLSLYV